MTEEYFEDASGPDGGAHGTVSEDASPSFTRAVAHAMRLMGRTAELARRMAHRTAAGIVLAGQRARSAPFHIRSFGSWARAARLTKRRLARVNVEIAQQESILEDTCAKIGRRLYELGREDASVLPDDAQLVALMSDLCDLDERIKDLTAERLRLARNAAEAEAEGAAPRASMREGGAGPDGAARAAAPETVDADGNGASRSRPPEDPETGPSGQDARPSGADLPEEMAAVVREHPEGIVLVEIGKRLDVPWRTLVPVARELVEGRRIRKDGRRYCPP